MAMSINAYTVIRLINWTGSVDVARIQPSKSNSILPYALSSLKRNCVSYRANITEHTIDIIVVYNLQSLDMRKINKIT